ncbi:DUF2269 domain-containing protein [Rugamonas sp. DEMB1]|uniref:DUF2269 family protein n=1 Tax=Rugamonas sp. DEMB1 TaxID=3039386 RepID=UPI002448D454|nr:DUF2269 domain-containing protein [Rugamonas sp. DEMB1]WGG51598.1 DUF2269 domain-containing protein [Rugamonas sp. DEMB1]
MNFYLMLKWLHILSATILFGTGIGIAFFKWISDRSGDVRAIRLSSERTVLADWIFTTPAVVAQPLSGLAMALLASHPITTGWLAWSILLYAVAGACWLPVVWLQLRMRAIARAADEANTVLPALYWRYARYWFWLGVPAFLALLVVYWLMVAKPAL